ncbi:MAG: Dps family protein [Hyphomicrobium sp.]
MATSASAKSPKIAVLDTGLSSNDRKDVANRLVDILADTYTLLLKTHVYHWNVVGPLFLPVHELTEKHYNDLFEAADVIAERIRALGALAPLSFRQMQPNADVAEETTNRSAEQMIAQLVADHQKMVKNLRDAAKAAEDVDDLVTVDLLTDRLKFHEKAIWMLSAFLV